MLTGGVALAAQSGTLLAQSKSRPHPAANFAAGFRAELAPDAPRCKTDAAPHQRTANRSTHGSNQPLLFQFERCARASDAGLSASTRLAPQKKPLLRALFRPPFSRMSRMALIQGHGGVGIVEAVGPEVRRVQVGDRVCVSGTPQCGSCYQCLRGRADMCQFLGRQGPSDLVPIADMRDGTPVYANSHIGGLAELMVTFEEWVVPVFTKASAVDLGMVCSCVAVAGLGCTASQVLAAIEHRFHRCRGRMRSLGIERHSRRAHCRSLHHHRDRSHSCSPGSGAESRRNSCPGSECRRRQAGGESARTLEWSEQSSVGRRPRFRRTVGWRGRGLRG